MLAAVLFWIIGDKVDAPSYYYFIVVCYGILKVIGGAVNACKERSDKDPW